jgi:hypothetical protein
MTGTDGGPKNVTLVHSIGTTALLKRFYDEEDNDLYNTFVHLKQKGSVNDYTHEWKVLATRKNGFTYERLLKTYICGLKDYICSEIKLWNHIY